MRKSSRRREGVAVVGMDLSLRGTAVVALPRGWQPEDPWRDVRTMTIGGAAMRGEHAVQAKRLDSIADAVERFVLGLPSMPEVFVEDYAYGLAARGGIQTAELGGAVKRTLYRTFMIVATPVNNMTARKYLLGKLPTGKGKAVLATHAAVRSMVPTCFSSFNAGADEIDAWVVANYARTTLGLPGVTLG